MALLFTKIVPVKKGYYEVEFVKLYESLNGVTNLEPTEAHIKELEKLVIEKPEYWLWTHRRWKHKKVKNV